MASWYEVRGVSSLNGEIKIQGSKNSVLPILAATILTDERVVIHNCPMITDVFNMVAILEKLGCIVHINAQEHYIAVDSSNITTYEIDKELTGRLRSSIVFLGALLSRTGMARITYPGGCKIGTRPIDMHIEALQKIGAIIEDDNDVIKASMPCDRNKEVRIKLRYPSVGTTENIILASAVGRNKVIIENAAKDPEILELIKALSLMGAKIYNKDSYVQIDGVPKLKGIDYYVNGDRIVAATYMAMVGITSGCISMRGIDEKCLSTYIDILRKMGIRIKRNKKHLINKGEFYKNELIIESDGDISPINIKTGPYPQIPTDVQPMIMALATKAKGVSVIEESVFENRFEVVDQMRKFGAEISVVNNNIAVVNGSREQHCADVFSSDLRAGAALVIMALGIPGVTRINNIEYILRGYENIVKDIAILGGRIRLVNEEENFSDFSCVDCLVNDSRCICL